MFGTENPWTNQEYGSRSPIGVRAFESARRLAFLSGSSGEGLKGDLPTLWHATIFGPLGCQPAERIGTYRSALDLRAYVFAEETGKESWITTLPDLVDVHVDEIVSEVNESVDLARALSPREVFGLLPELLADYYSRWLKVHPFCDGNGRTGVCLVDWICGAVGAAPFMLRSAPNTLFFGEEAEESVRVACQKPSDRDISALMALFAGELEISLR